MAECIKVMWAEDLPLDTQKELKVFSGLVEVTLVRNSPLEIKNIVPLSGKFSEAFRRVLANEGFLGKITLAE